MNWFKVKDELHFLGGMLLLSLTFWAWLLGIIVLGLPFFYLIENPNYIPQPITLGQLVIGAILLILGTLFFFIAERLSKW